MIRVTVKETGTKEFLERLKRLERISLEDAGEIIRKRMIGFIDENRKREPKKVNERFQGKYAKHIKDVIDIQVTKDGVGIGSIDKMNKEVPYWLVVNNGGYVPPPTHGYFGSGNPQGGAGGDSSFTYSKKGPLMKPNRPIAPMNYIEKTMAWSKQYLTKYIDSKIKGTK